VVVAPSYNNAGTVLAVLKDIATLGLPIIVVDDGCTDSTSRLLEGWLARGADGSPHVESVRHDRNMGKAQALLSGIGAARARGHTHAVTIDTDGQHDAASIPALLRAARRSPRALVLGSRAWKIDGCPARSTVGRRLSNLAIRWECGARIKDSQCGLRVYPIDLVVGDPSLRWTAGRFAFEAEVITRAVWAGVPIEEIEVTCRYLARDMRVSHFRPWRDSLEGVALHARLLTLSLARSRGASERE
jgi:glycosyltransferase involved in cell wall biosynthesis